MTETAAFQNIKPGNRVRLTAMGAALTASVMGDVTKVEEDRVNLRFEEADLSAIRGSSDWGEYLMRVEEPNADDLTVVLLGPGAAPGEMSFKAGPDNRRRYMRVVADFRLTYEILKTDQEIQDAIYQLQHSASAEAKTPLTFSGGEGQDLTLRVQRLEGLVLQLSDMLGELGEKADYLVAKADGREAQLPPRRQGAVYDVSGVGLSFFTNDPDLEEGGMIQAHFEISQTGYQRVRCVGKVVRFLPSDRAGKKHIALEFHFISEDDRDKIVKYAFSVQRQFLRIHRDSG